MTSVAGGSWPAPGAASDVGGGMLARDECADGGLALGGLTMPVSVGRGTAICGRGERIEDAL